MTHPSPPASNLSLHHDIPLMIQEIEEAIKATEVAVLDIIKIIENKTGHSADETADILQSLTFQDIVGQRLTKVLKFLQEFEKEIKNLEKVLEKEGTISFHKKDPISSSDEKSLLNGPQLPGSGTSQEDVDTLLKPKK